VLAADELRRRAAGVVAKLGWCDWTRIDRKRLGNHVHAALVRDGELVVVSAPPHGFAAVFTDEEALRAAIERGVSADGATIAQVRGVDLFAELGRRGATGVAIDPADGDLPRSFGGGILAGIAHA